METNIMKGRQILGSFFMIMIVLFIIGNSNAQAKGKISEPAQQQSFSTTLEIRISPEEGEGHRKDHITQPDLFASIYSIVPVSKNAERLDLGAIKINPLSWNGCFLLPGIHAP